MYVQYTSAGTHRLDYLQWVELQAGPRELGSRRDIEQKQLHTLPEAEWFACLLFCLFTLLPQTANNDNYSCKLKKVSWNGVSLDGASWLDLHANALFA